MVVLLIASYGSVTSLGLVLFGDTAPPSPYYAWYQIYVQYFVTLSICPIVARTCLVYLSNPKYDKRFWWGLAIPYQINQLLPLLVGLLFGVILTINKYI